MLVPAIQWNRKQSSRLPLKRDAVTLVIPNRCGSSSGEHIDHLFKELALGLELLAGCNLHHIAIIGRPRGFVIDVNTLAAASGPRLQIHGVQAWHIVRTDDVQTLCLDPSGVGGFFFSGELLRQIFGD